MIAAILDWIPVISFFVSYKISGIYFATKVLMVASSIQILAIKYVLKNKVTPTSWAILALVLVMGSLTLFFHNDAFIKWKPTVLYLAFAMAFFFAPIIKRESLAELMLASKIKLPTKSWQTLNNIFVIFFIIMSALNTFIFLNFSTATWVNYKLFGTLAITIIFMSGVSYYLMKNKLVD